MYKLFLCLRYLFRKPLAYAGMVSVALCVAMMLIVVSVMNGFLDKIEEAAKGLFGDIVVDSGSQHGIPRYDEIIQAVTAEVGGVKAGSPFILSYGVLRVPQDPNYRQFVQIAGVRLPERVDVSDFGKGLFVQAGVERPTFDPDPKLISDRLEEKIRETQAILDREGKSEKGGTESISREDLVDRLGDVIRQMRRIRANLDGIAARRPEMRELVSRLAKLKEQRARGAPDPSDQTRKLDEQIAAAEDQLQKLVNEIRYLPPDYRLVLGLGIQGLTIRTRDGEVVRLLLPTDRVALYIFPGGRFTASDMTPNRKLFTVIDDCRTDVSTIDSMFVYVPFSTLQRLNNMDQPNRCSQIHFKVADALRSERNLKRVAGEIEEVLARLRRTPQWQEFMRQEGWDRLELSVHTWRERQARIVAPIESQRTLVVVMFGVISVVALLLIVVIFSMIVVQKTKDIGVLKAIGASSPGVAGIFLVYGAAVGFFGSVVGIILGYYFVHYINPIHDAMGRWFNFQVWRREWFLFDKIPNQVNWMDATIILLCAIAAGVLGALIPAIKAARMQPVEALRYE